MEFGSTVKTKKRIMSYQGKTREELEIWHEEINYRGKKGIQILNNVSPYKKKNDKEKVVAMSEYLEEELKSLDRQIILDKDRSMTNQAKRDVVKNILEYLNLL